MTESFYGQQQPETTASEFNATTFLVMQLLSRIQTLTLVEVMACTNAGDLSPVGTVDVRPLVNQMTGNRQSVPHGTIYGIPYFRMQGGDNAVIIDPEKGDIGMCGFCSRDISSVKSAKAQANPGSFRTFDFADGLYVGGFLNGTPKQYVQFSSAGVAVVSPTKISLRAPVLDFQASESVTINSPANTIGGGNTSIDDKPFLPHEHLDSGGSGNGGPVA